MRRLSALLAPVAFLLTGCPVVTLTPVPATVPSAGTSAIGAVVTVKAGGAMVPAPPGTVTYSVPAPHAIAPASTPTAVGTGAASSTFTAGPVDRPTPVTITAKYGAGTGTTVVTVVPPPMTAPFTAAAGDDVTVAPVVTPPGTGWTYVYTVTPGATGRILNGISISFQHDVTVRSSVGTAAGYGTIPKRNWQVVNGAALAGPITITVTGDFSPGGTATWDILSQVTPNTVVHARPTTVGPAP